MENLTDAEEELMMAEGDDEHVPYPFFLPSCCINGGDLRVNTASFKDKLQFAIDSFELLP